MLRRVGVVLLQLASTEKIGTSSNKYFIGLVNIARFCRSASISVETDRNPSARISSLAVCNDRTLGSSNDLERPAQDLG